MNNIFPFIKLKSFKNGWRYSGKLKEFINIKHYDHLKSINDNDIEKIASFLNATILNNKIFKSFSWVLYFNPVPLIEIYFFCERNEKTGDKFSIFFGKDGALIPIEDIYSFALIYISLLSLIGKNIKILEQKASSNNFIFLLSTKIGYTINLANLEKFTFINNIIKDEKKISFIAKPFRNILVKYIFTNGSVSFYACDETLKIYPESLIKSIATLICNSILKEFKGGFDEKG